MQLSRVNRRERTVAERLHAAAIHLLRRLRRQDDAMGLTPARASALSIMVFGGRVTIGQLAQAEQVSAPTMTRLVVGLERDGLVRRDDDPHDGRVVWLQATAKGTRDPARRPPAPRRGAGGRSRDARRGGARHARRGGRHPRTGARPAERRKQEVGRTKSEVDGQPRDAERPEAGRIGGRRSWPRARRPRRAVAGAHRAVGPVPDAAPWRARCPFDDAVRTSRSRPRPRLRSRRAGVSDGRSRVARAHQK